jgi:hypothetical protein
MMLCMAAISSLYCAAGMLALSSEVVLLALEVWWTAAGELHDIKAQCVCQTLPVESPSS